MRFEISRVLDAIEGRLSTDPVLACAVVDVGEVLRAVELDGGRPAYLPRLGAVIDALAVQLDDASVPVYGIVERGLLSSLELTSNEKMVLRRWADDGLVEVLADADPGRRLIEVAEITGWPVLSRNPLPVVTLLTPVPGIGGVALIERHAESPRASRSHPTPTVVSRGWRCPDGESVPIPLLLTTGRPTCPRHGQPLVDEGPSPQAASMTVWVGGVARSRFRVDAAAPVVVGRSPARGIMLGPWLDDESLQWISRAHVELSVTGDGLTVTDRSTNGTVVVCGDRREELIRDQGRPVVENEIIELYQGVEIVRSGHRPRLAMPAAVGIMAEAPTIALRVPQ